MDTHAAEVEGTGPAGAPAVLKNPPPSFHPHPKYKLGALIAEGAQAKVYEASLTESGEKVILKIIKLTLTAHCSRLQSSLKSRIRSTVDPLYTELAKSVGSAWN